MSRAISGKTSLNVEDVGTDTSITRENSRVFARIDTRTTCVDVVAGVVACCNAGAVIDPPLVLSYKRTPARR